MADESSEKSPSAEEKYILLSTELRNLLKERGVGISDLKNMVGTEASLKTDPATQPEGAREPVTIILASAAAIVAATPAILQLIRTFQRPPTVEERELVPVTDKNGNIERRPNGEAILAWRERLQVGENKPSAGTEQKISMRLPGVEFGLSSKG